MTFAFLIDSVPFTADVIAGRTSLGGSESACLGLARALRARGHEVHCFATRLEPKAAGAVDGAGVVWHRSEDFVSINQWIEWDVAVALRQCAWFGQAPVHAKLRILWNQDLLVGNAGSQIMSILWAVDRLAYVSAYHRAQWEDAQPEFKSIGWVTKNGFDPSLVPTSVTKDPNRIIHISRPERGLGPILEMWPALKQRNPDATLHICRYQSMYDGEGSNVRAMCLSFDDEVTRVNAAVGGISYLGSLNKGQLYQAIAEAAVMWYPGVHDFAETSCIAAIEAQACGTPFVGSYKGALPETVPHGALVHGDARGTVYQKASIDHVLSMLDGCRQQKRFYRDLQIAGRRHVENYTFDVLASEWEQAIESWFTNRYEENKGRVLEQLLHDDDHTAARVVASEILENYHVSKDDDPMYGDAHDALQFCERVIAGKDQVAEDYSANAIQDPLDEVKISERFKTVNPYFESCTRVLDVACGNGAFAIGLALAYPNIHVHGMDYAAANIASAQDAAFRAGVSDRCTFEQRTVYDFDAQNMHAEWTWFASVGREFDGLFCGEFVEHVANCSALIDGLEAVLVAGAKVVYTCPHGPFTEMLPREMPVRRGHVHSFRQPDVKAVWGPKRDSGADYFAIGITERGASVGHWLIHYTVEHGRKAGTRNYDEVVRRTRPMQKLTVGLITKDAENDLGRCLKSIWHIADEILIGDTGSTDATKTIAESYRARVFDIAPIKDQPEGFAGARNAVLKEASGDWFFWIDADEQLLEPQLLRRYLDGAVFNGFVLHQTHLYIDQAPTWDIPVRVFRTNRDIRFYGCIHEQPQMGGPNGDIHPTLEPYDVQLAHTGYLTNDVREMKRMQRNYPLVIVDQKVFPERILGKVILMRETVLQADTYRAEAQGALTERAAKGYELALTIWDAYFTDPHHKLHKLARPWYEAALKGLGRGFEMEVALAGKLGGLGHNHARPERVWVRDIRELERLLAWQTAEMKKRVEPAACKTDPFTSETGSFGTAAGGALPFVTKEVPA